MTTGDLENYFAENLPKYQPGQLIRHRRYGYRGVVVDFDMRCHADDDWYYANRTQPNCRQPWYHILVDGSPQITYAAESNVEPDTCIDPVQHPLIGRFFDSFTDGGYQRNDEPWQGWAE